MWPADSLGELIIEFTFNSLFYLDNNYTPRTHDFAHNSSGTQTVEIIQNRTPTAKT